MSIRVVGSNLVHQIPVKQADSGGGGGGGGGSVTVDSELSLSSENPVQNKVITEALNGLDNVFVIGGTYIYDETIQAEIYTLNKTFDEIKSAFRGGKICYIYIPSEDQNGIYCNSGIVTYLLSTEYSSYIYVVSMGIDALVPLSSGTNNATVARSMKFTASSGTDYPICRF